MGPLDIFNHTLNFMAPAAALALALVLVLSGRFFGAPGGAGLSGWRQFAVVFVVGLVVLGGGLLVWGRDGKMLTYAALVVGCATTQWVLLRGWR